MPSGSPVAGGSGGPRDVAVAVAGRERHPPLDDPPLSYADRNRVEQGGHRAVRAQPDHRGKQPW